MKKFGLIGFPLGHSFSKKYFSEKFEQLNLPDHSYDLFEMETVDGFLKLWEDKELRGVNVTVPHKQHVLPYLDHLDASAEKVGAVNVIKRKGHELVGYNSDYYGFLTSLKYFLGEDQPAAALVLGTGGASRAVVAALMDLNIECKLVSRSKEKSDLTYQQVAEQPQILQESRLIINTTPLGMHPQVTSCPELPYDYLCEQHCLFDLVYNPEETAFMKKGLAVGAKAKNGLEMLHLQADKAWEIWND